MVNHDQYEFATGELVDIPYRDEQSLFTIARFKLAKNRHVQVTCEPMRLPGIGSSVFLAIDKREHNLKITGHTVLYPGAPKDPEYLKIATELIETSWGNGIDLTMQDALQFARDKDHLFLKQRLGPKAYITIARLLKLDLTKSPNDYLLLNHSDQLFGGVSIGKSRINRLPAPIRDQVRSFQYIRGRVYSDKALAKLDLFRRPSEYHKHIQLMIDPDTAPIPLYHMQALAICLEKALGREPWISLPGSSPLLDATRQLIDSQGDFVELSELPENPIEPDGDLVYLIDSAAENLSGYGELLEWRNRSIFSGSNVIDLLGRMNTGVMTKDLSAPLSHFVVSPGKAQEIASRLLSPEALRRNNCRSARVLSDADEPDLLVDWGVIIGNLDELWAHSLKCARKITWIQEQS